MYGRSRSTCPRVRFLVMITYSLSYQCLALPVLQGCKHKVFAVRYEVLNRVAALWGDGDNELQQDSQRDGGIIGFKSVIWLAIRAMNRENTIMNVCKRGLKLDGADGCNY